MNGRHPAMREPLRVVQPDAPVAPPPTAAERAAALQSRAKAAAAEAVEDLFAPLSAAAEACEAVAALEHVGPGIRERARSLAMQIRFDANAILLQQGRRP